MLKLATYIRAKRLELGWSQCALARRSGYFAGAGACIVSHLERGVVQGLRRETIIRIGSALGCRQELLLVAGFAPEIDDLGKLDRELARSIRAALEAGMCQDELAQRLREWAHGCYA